MCSVPSSGTKRRFLSLCPTGDVTPPCVRRPHAGHAPCWLSLRSRLTGQTHCCRIPGLVFKSPLLYLITAPKPFTWLLLQCIGLKHDIYRVWYYLLLRKPLGVLERLWYLYMSMEKSLIQVGLRKEKKKKTEASK